MDLYLREIPSTLHACISTNKAYIEPDISGSSQPLGVAKKASRLIQI